ncbi:MAG: N-acetylmuramoyl-L-alanine amidase [Clostridia bacterium]|nr:N-acetylmuramoyl-L-alanine amidase [Clostridia bacterium]
MKAFFLRFASLFTALCLVVLTAGTALISGHLSSGGSILADNLLSVNNGAQIFTVILDPGHGGQDGGAQSADGTLEKDLNLQLSLCLADLLSAMGYRVLLTRSEDVMLGEGAKGHKKLADLKYRLDFANEYPDALLISIHMNKFPMDYCKGIQLYYSGNHENSLLFANALHPLVKGFQGDNNREIKQAGSAIYLLDRVRIPAVLVECGFLSNANEAELLKNTEYQQQLALLIASALCTYETQVQTA